MYFIIFWGLIFAFSFILLCCFNSYRLKIANYKIWLNILDSIKSAFKELCLLVNPNNPYGKTQYLLKIILLVSFIQFVSLITRIITPTIVFLGYFAIVICFNLFFLLKRKKLHKNKKLSKDDTSFLFKIKNIFLIPIWKYVKNHNRLYLRINFGHKLKDEKDILRLITRTLSTEYNKYHSSIKRMLPWRIIAIVLLLLFACLFSSIIDIKNDINLPKDSEYSKDVYSEVDIKVDNKVEVKVVPIVGVKAGNIFHILKSKIFENINKAINTLIYLLGINENLNIDNNKINKLYFLCDYHFWFSFILMYFFCVLIFSCNWITPFFVTHRIIMRRLKKLNSDITHSTEHENSIGINSGKSSNMFGIKTKKTRNIADAREIEKELQDILSDMRRIPVIMCRPNIVIVFDELDKVELGDTGSEKENQQTKASLFSIHATRDRQTEILRILSNMKYFLSTAKAKFLFIAGREMFDIHLADVSERNNYIGSIFNVVILVPSFLSDHQTGIKTIPQESSITSLPEEFVCRRLIPHDYPVESFNLESYRIYLEKKIFNKDTKNNKQKEKIDKTIAVLQQFIIYLAHVSKGAPKKMIQLFESFIEIRTDRENKKNILLVQRYHSSRHFLSFNYYKQYTLGIIAYLITPIFYFLAESKIKELSDKLLVSSLRFVDFLFKFHKNSFSWKHLDMSPEMLEVNRAPELKSVAVYLLNYLAQIHINKSNFSLSEYKFDGLIANEIFAMAKTDEVFSALFSFSLDEMLPLKKHYQELLEKKENEYQKKKKTSIYIDAISSLQGVLGDLHYYDDELEEAESYYKSAVQALQKSEEMSLERLYVYVRNMLRLGIIYEKRKQYDFAYLTYGELCELIIFERNTKKPSLIKRLFKNKVNTNDVMLFEKIAYEGLKILYLPFIAKLQIIEKSHIGGITRNHLEQLDEEFKDLTHDINHKEAKLLEAEFYSRVADILYYKNSDLKCKKGENRKKDEDKSSDNNTKILPDNCSCTACYYYHKAFSILLNEPDFDKFENKSKNTVIKLLCKSNEQLKKNENKNYNMKICTILARILSDWGNVFFSCDTKNKENGYECYICDKKNFNTISEKNNNNILENCIKYLESDNGDFPFLEEKQLETKKDIAFVMYTISSVAYRKASLYKRSSYQIYKMLRLFKDYEIYKCEKLRDYLNQLSEIAIHYLWHANDDLNVLELNKRKKDFDKDRIDKKIPLQYILVDNEITRIWIMVKELELKSDLSSKKFKEFYDFRITSPYKINYSIVGHIFRLWLKSKINYNTYQQLIENLEKKEETISEIEYILNNDECNKTAKEIFGDYFNFNNEKKAKIEIFENLLAETIYCLIDISQLTETMDETYIFTHYFLGSIHDKLSFWIMRYEEYEKYIEKEEFREYKRFSRIKKYLKQYLDEEWREQLSGYRENQRALSHYHKSFEMHNEGRTYHNMIDTLCYVKDDFNDRSDHFNIAEERHLIVNGNVDKKIDAIKGIYKESKLYKIENY